jgi:signal transduction histidine kinase
VRDLESVHRPTTESEIDLERLRRRVGELESELADAERRSEAWISAVSHDLRGPLTLVQGYAENLLHRVRSSGANGQDIRELEAIVTAARRLNKMVSQVVDGARIEGRRIPIRLRRTTLAALIDSRVRAAARMYPHQRFRTDLADFDGAIISDSRAIESIVGALLSNAAIFSPDGSTVEVKLQRAGDWVKLTVHDHGLGFDPEELESAFEPRFRPQRAREFRREGLGVSLWIARSLADLLGGVLTIESPGADRGTLATLQLPVTDVDSTDVDLGDPT